MLYFVCLMRNLVIAYMKQTWKDVKRLIRKSEQQSHDHLTNHF